MNPRGGRGESREIDEEVRFHIEGRTEELIAAGVPAEEARARAVAAFGDVSRVREELRAIGVERARRDRRRESLGGWSRDVRTGWRRLVRSPGHTTIAVLTLALGIGASVATFSVLDAIVLRPLPFPAADRLVELWPTTNMNISMSRIVGDGVSSVASYTGRARWSLTLTGEGEALEVQAEVVDAGYFDVFGVTPQLGRVFRREETDPARSDVVLIGDAFWRTRFGGDRDVIGRRVRLDGYLHETREIIGVMPPGYRGLDGAADVWIPLHLAPERTFEADSTWYVNALIARLAPGATLARADAEVRTVATRMRADQPGRIDEDAARTASAVGVLDSMVGDVRGTLWMLLGAVGLVLLMACANLANLLLARGVGLRKDMAVRTALGASRWQLVRQQLVESGLIAITGGAVGVLIARVSLGAVRMSESSGLPRAAGVGIDARVLAFALAACALSVLAFGVLPALRVSRGHTHADLAAASRGGSASRSTHRLNRSLVGAELALAMVLTTAAGLMLSSFSALRSVDPGLDASDVLTMRVMPPPARYEGAAAVQFYDELLGRIAAMPGVTSAGGIQLLPFRGGNWSFPYLAEGHAPPSDGPLPFANFRIVTAGYFDAMDIPLLDGRRLSPDDRAGAPRALIINAALARQLWPGESAVGREIRVFGSMSYRVVGVVGDVHQHTLERAPSPEMYVSHAQWSGVTALALAIEGPGALTLGRAVTDAVHALDGDVPVADVEPLSAALGSSLARRRFFASVLTGFGILALLLGGLGVYGVMSHLIGARIRDFGLRMALGAGRRQVLGEALRGGIAPVAFGLIAGTAGAVASARLLRGLLFDVAPVNVPTYAIVAVVLVAVAGLATWLPARRAARTDPLSVLRSD